MFRIKENVALSDSGFLFNPETGESFTVNPMGNKIIEMLREGKDYDEISGFIREKYDVNESTFEKDFQDFTQELFRYQLIGENEAEN